MEHILNITQNLVMNDAILKILPLNVIFVALLFIMRNIIQENTKKLLEEKKLKPLRQPKVEVTKYKKDEPVELNLKIDLVNKIFSSERDKLFIKDLISSSIDSENKFSSNSMLTIILLI